MRFFLGKPLKTYTGARSTKITNLLFFDSRLVAAISPRVFRCFEKVIFLDFEVRNCENPRVFTLSPLKNTKSENSRQYRKTSLFDLFLDLQNGAFSYRKAPQDPPGTPEEPPKKTQDPSKSLRCRFLSLRGRFGSPPGSILEPPGSILEPPGSNFEPPGAEFGPILHKSGHKAQNVKKNRVRHGPLGV